MDSAAARRTQPTALSIAARIARRELRGGFRSFWLFCLCLTLGVGAIALVQSVSRAALDGIYENGREILGGDISLDRRYTPPPEDAQTLARSSGKVSQSLTTSAFVSTVAGEVATVMLKAVDNAWPLYGKPDLSPALSLDKALEFKHVNGIWGAVVHPALLQRLNVKVGDRLKLNDTTLEIRAELISEPDIASERGFPIGPRVLISQDAFAASGLLVEGSLMRWKTRIAVQDESTRGQELAPLLAKFKDLAHDQDWSVQSFENAAPRVSGVIKRMTVFLSLVSLAALIVGGIGMSDAVRAFLDGRLRTLSILKFIGATHETVVLSCLLQIIFMAVISIVLGLIFGILGQNAAAILLGNALTFKLGTSIQAEPLLLAAAMGGLVTAIFALWPLGRLRHARAADVFQAAISPLSGLPSWRVLLCVCICTLSLVALIIFSAQDRYFAALFSLGAICLLFVYWLAATAALKLMGLLPPFGSAVNRLGIGNLRRHRNAAVMVIQSLGLGLTVLTGIILVERNISDQITSGIPTGAPSFFFLNVQAHEEQVLQDLIDETPNANLTASAKTLSGRLIRVNGADAKTTLKSNDEWLVRGDRMVSFSATQPSSTEMVEGEWWPENYEGPPLVSVSNDIIEGFGVGIGDTVTLRVLGREITAKIANVRNVEWGRQMKLDFVFVYSPNTFYGAPYQILATAHTALEVESTLLRKVARDLPSVTMIRLRETLEAVNALVGKVSLAVKSIASLVIFSSIVVLGGAIAASHRQRLYETVLFKTLGLTRRQLVKAYLIEYGIIAFLAASVALFAGGLVSWWIVENILGSNWQFFFSTAFGTVFISTCVVVGFGFLEAWRTLGRPVRPELDQGG